MVMSGNNHCEPSVLVSEQSVPRLLVSFHLDVSRSALRDPMSLWWCPGRTRTRKLEPSRSAKVTLDDFLESALKVFVEVRINDGVE